MSEFNFDPPEFTDDQLQAALQRMGEKAVREAFAIGRPVMIAREDWVIRLFPDGHEEVVGPIDLPAVTHR